VFTYQEALDYIYSFADVEKVLAGHPVKFELSRTEALLELLDNPHRRYKAVHIAGTKGKGSTTAMTESILRSAGYKTGLFTSPHLHSYRERIRVDGQLIGEDELITLLERLIPYIERVPQLTTFEITTALAFLHFAEKGVEWALLETGLGGRLDTTNVVDPAVVVITLIGYDHTQFLGHRLEEIAQEKAGIIKEGKPVVCAPQRPTALKVLKGVCRERNAPLTLVGRDWTWERDGFDLRGQRVTIRCWKRPPSPNNALCKDYVNLFIPLLGEHQLVNATTAVATVAELARQGVIIPPKCVAQGLKQVPWPGRMEVLNQRPLLVLDGAHNVDSARALTKALLEYFDYQRLILILGFSADKDIRAILRHLLPLAHQVIITRSKHPRAASFELMEEEISAMGCKPLSSPSVEEALWQALRSAQEGDLICVTGSLFVMAEARATWLESQGISFERD